MSDKQVSTKTIKSYLAGVRSYQVDIGLHDMEAFHHSMLQRIMTGIRRLRGERDKRERRPITRDILLKLIGLLNKRTLDGASLHAAFCTAFAAFLRCGEFTYTSGEAIAPDFDA